MKKFAVILLTLITSMSFVAGFNGIASATNNPDQCNQEFNYTKSSDYSDSRVNINFESSDRQIDVSGVGQYQVISVELDVEDDGHSGYFQYASGPLNNFNPNPGDEIRGAKVKVKKICSTPTATPTPTQVPNKVTICHATGAGTFQTIHVNENAISGHFENNGTPKDGHEDDILLQGEVDCPSATPTPTITQTDPTPTPSDDCNGVCDNTNTDPTPTVTEDQPTVTPTATETPREEPTATPTTEPGNPGGPGDGRSDGLSSCPECTKAPQGQVLGASTSVLGASTMAKTGAFEGSLMNIVGIFGMLLMTAGYKSYAKDKKSI